MRYSPIARSVPENSATKRSGSGCRLSAITARRSPAAQPSVRRCSAAAPVVGQRDARRGEQLARLALGEPQIAGPDLGDLVGEPELVQLIGGSRRDDSTTRAELGSAVSRCSSCGSAAGSTQLVEIVDDQNDGLDVVGELRDDARRPAGRRRGRSRIGRSRAGLRIGVQDGAPEPLPRSVGRGRRTRTRRDAGRRERSAHARSSEVFPLPGGAEMTVTRLATARSSSWRRSPRSSRLWVSRGLAWHDGHADTPLTLGSSGQSIVELAAARPSRIAPPRLREAVTLSPRRSGRHRGHRHSCLSS